jgi:hypothetical protein
MLRALSASGIAVLLACLIATIAMARDQLYSIGFPQAEGNFNVLDGKPYLLRRGESGPAGSAIDLQNGKNLVHFGSRQPLCYDLAGTTPTVSLGKTDSTSADWQLKHGKEKGGQRAVFIQAADGKYQGWFLDWSAEEIEIESGGKTYHARPLVLKREPRPAKVFSMYPVAP